MGYSVMAVDASSHFSDDPYVYLKAPPLARASLVTLTHGSLAPMVSATFLYAQNASAGGPVAWMLAEAIERVRMHAWLPVLLPVVKADNKCSWFLAARRHLQLWTSACQAGARGLSCWWLQCPLIV